MHVPPSLGEGPRGTGLDGFKPLVTALHAAFADLHFTVHDTTAADNVVMVSWTMTGTHQSEWQGIPATGRRVLEPRGVARFVRQHGALDRGAALPVQKLGALVGPLPTEHPRAPGDCVYNPSHCRNPTRVFAGRL